MWPIVGDTLPQAVAIAISPVPVALVILILVSGRAKTNGLAFAAGWVVGAAATVSIVAAVAGATIPSDSSDAADSVNWVQLLLGLLLAGLAVRQWKHRPKPGEAPEQPKLFAAVDSLSAAKSAGIGLFAASANPKNLALAVSAGATIAHADLQTSSMVGSIAIYTIIASITVLVPVGAYLIAGERARGTLDATKEWLTFNNATIMIVLFTILAAKLIGSGLHLGA